MASKQPIGALTCATCGQRADLYMKGGKLLGFLYSKGCRCGYRDRQSYDFQAELWKRAEWFPGRKPEQPPPSVRNRHAHHPPAAEPAPPATAEPAPVVMGEPAGEWFRMSTPEGADFRQTRPEGGVTRKEAEPEPLETPPAGDSGRTRTGGKPRALLAILGALAAGAGFFIVR